MEASADVLVVGGGAIGLGIAWRMAQRGASVTVIDQGPMAAEASSHAAGMLVPLAEVREPGPFLDLCLASNRLYPAFAEELLACTGVNIEYGRAGMLQVALGESEARELSAAFAWLQTLPFNVQRLDGQALRARESSISPKAAAGIFVPSEGWVTTRRLAEALTQAAAAAGVRLLPNHPLTGVEREGSRVTAVRAGAERLPAGQFVIAAGPWSGQAGEHFGTQVPVFPVRGQLIALEGEPPLFGSLIYRGGVYLVPRFSGEVIVGSTSEHVGFRKEVTAEGVGGLLRGAMAVVPGLAGRAILRTWACLRPGTPDELPILGRAPGLDNVFLATGHYRNGILLSPITADLMADVLQDKPPSIPLHAFRPDRPSLVSPSAA